MKAEKEKRNLKPTFRFSVAGRIPAELLCIKCVNYGFGIFFHPFLYRSGNKISRGFIEAIKHRSSTLHFNAASVCLPFTPVSDLFRRHRRVKCKLKTRIWCHGCRQSRSSLATSTEFTSEVASSIFDYLCLIDRWLLQFQSSLQAERVNGTCHVKNNQIWNIQFLLLQMQNAWITTTNNYRSLHHDSN